MAVVRGEGAVGLMEGVDVVAPPAGGSAFEHHSDAGLRVVSVDDAIRDGRIGTGIDGDDVFGRRLAGFVEDIEVRNRTVAGFVELDELAARERAVEVVSVD